MANDRNYWFRAHSFGVGTAPHTWQGWLACIIYSSAVLLAVRVPGDAAKAALIISITVPFIWLCVIKTDWHRTESKGNMAMIGFFTKRAHLPWLIAIAAALLSIGIALLVSA